MIRHKYKKNFTENDRFLKVSDIQLNIYSIVPNLILFILGYMIIQFLFNLYLISQAIKCKSLIYGDGERLKDLLRMLGIYTSKHTHKHTQTNNKKQTLINS